MFDKLLIANRGAIACRILRTLKQLDVQGVAVYSEADAASLHIQQADEAWTLGEGAASSTYLNVSKILDVAKQTGADRGLRHRHIRRREQNVRHRRKQAGQAGTDNGGNDIIQ